MSLKQCACGHPAEAHIPLSVAEELADALELIRRDEGKVCPEFELCTHAACNSSYAAWAIADEALARFRDAYPKENTNGG